MRKGSTLQLIVVDLITDVGDIYYHTSSVFYELRPVRCVSLVFVPEDKSGRYFVGQVAS
jgi:hypothetical protein